MLIKITYDLADPAGIMYFANVYHLAHKNIEHWLEDEYGLWQTWFNNKNFGVPIKHSQCEYFRPMIAGNDYQVVSKVKNKGQSSLTIETSFMTAKQDICAQVETVHVFIDRSNMKKIDIPQEISTALKL